MTKPPDEKPSGPIRIPPSGDTAEALERLVRRNQVRLTQGDVVIVRELVPRLQPSTKPRWWFRVSIYRAPETDSLVFTSFHHAASHAEQLATQHHARLLFIEDDVTTLLNDYRP